MCRFSQNLRIARRERRARSYSSFARVKSSALSAIRTQCEVGLGQIRRERDRLSRIRLCPVIVFMRRRYGHGLPCDVGKRDRSGGEGERIVRIEANRFRVRGNCALEVLGVAYRS